MAENPDHVKQYSGVGPANTYERAVTENEDHMKRYSSVDPVDDAYDTSSSGPPKPSTDLKPDRLQKLYGSGQERRYDSITQEEIDSASSASPHYALYARQGGLQAEAAYTQMVGNRQMYGAPDAPEDDVEL